MDSDQEFEILPTPTKSPNDKREYRVIRLRNGLTACLISDLNSLKNDDESDQKMAAAALCVGVGSFSDPKNIPGLAHLLEHMLFMGSEKFPEENDFGAFVSKRGGSYNASTDREHTLFHFSCLENDFTEALDRFAQFFISPLMSKSSISREREAVDSEFQMALPWNHHRREQLILNFAKRESPASYFTYGNLLTLRDNVTEDELYESLHEFRKRHYSAHRMTLAIQAQLTLDQLQCYVLEYFNGVPTNGLPADDFSQFTDVFDTPEFTKMYYVEPASETLQLQLTWAFPSLRHTYKSKPLLYVWSRIANKGKGSLFSYLSKKHWALDVVPGTHECGGEHNSIHTVFGIYVELTKEGLNNIYEIIEAVFSYINLLKQLGPQERLFQEKKITFDLSFQFQAQGEAACHVQALCTNMHLYPPEDYMTGPLILFEYDPNFIEMVQNGLTPLKMNVMVLGDTLPSGVEYDRTEKWFGTKYTEQEFSEYWLERWQNVVPFEEFSLPPPNPFLTENFTIVEEDEDHPDYPEQILRTELMEVWYRKDQKFKLPVAYYSFCLVNPIMSETPKTSVLLDLYIDLVDHALTEDTDLAGSVGLSCLITPTGKGLNVTVSGLNEKLHILLELAAKCLANSTSFITEELFSEMKDSIIRQNYNELLGPLTLAGGIKSTILANRQHSPVDLYNVAHSITFEDMIEFSEVLFENVFIKVLIQGNVNKDPALDVANAFVKTLNCAPLDPSLYPYYRTRQIPQGQNVCLLQSFNTNDPNSVILNYYQSGPFSLTTSVTIEILMLMIQEDLFDALRTKETLGYSVSCFSQETYGILGFTISVTTQANKHTTSFVDERIEEFIQQVSECLRNLPEETFERTKSDLIRTKRCGDTDLREENYRNLYEIVGERYMFDRVKQEIAEIGKLKLEEVRNWWIEHTSDQGLRKLSVQVLKVKKRIAQKMMIRVLGVRPVLLNFVSGGEVERQYQKHVLINDLYEFKESLYLFPTFEKNISD